VDKLLDGFCRPFVGRAADHAISLVKAGMRRSGVDVGPVRPPLTGPDPDTVEELTRLAEAGRAALPGS
jgi:5-dehydro-4-deoxyglucarate dehydratase